MARCAAVLTAAMLPGLAFTGVAAAATGPFPLVPGSPFLSGSASDSGTFGIAYSPNGKFVFVSNYYAGKVASLAIGRDKLTILGQVTTGADPEGVAVSPNGSYLAVVNYGAGTVSMLTVSATGKLTKKETVSLPAGEAVAFNPAGTVLAVTDQSGNVTTFTVSAAGALKKIGAVSTGEGTSDDLAFSPGGAYLAVLDDDTGGTDPQATISVFSVASRGKLTLVAAPTSTGPAYNGNTGSNPDGVAFSPSGALLAVSDAANNDVLMYSVSSVGTLTSLGNPTPTQLSPAGIAFNPAGTLLATADSGTRGDVSFFTVGSGGSLTPIADEPADGSGGPQSLAFSPSGDLLGVTNMFPGAAGSVSEYNTTPASHSAIGGTWTVGPGGSFTGSAGTAKVTDTTTGYTITCTSSRLTGSLKSGTGLPGSAIGTITALDFSNCTAEGLTLSVSSGPVTYKINASSYAPGVTRGTLTKVHFAVSSSVCNAVIDGTSGTADNGKVKFTFTNKTDTLQIITTGSTLHFSDVTGCLGSISIGDGAKVGGSYKLTPAQTITSP